MTDQLSLSIWLTRGAQNNRRRQFEKLLRFFPFSQRSQPQSVVAIQAVSHAEPPLLERPLNGPVDIAEVLSIFNDYAGDDVAYEFESWWDLWQFDADWKLSPTRVALSCYGAAYDNGGAEEISEQEHLRIDFGVDTNFLPQTDLAGSTRLIESNIKSLLRLVHELDSALPIEARKLQTESGENFADRLQSLLTGSLRAAD